MAGWVASESVGLGPPAVRVGGGRDPSPGRRTPGARLRLPGGALEVRTPDSAAEPPYRIRLEPGELRVETYTVHVTKDYLVFCAAHFISYEKTRCERIHGHNYRVAAEITGPLDENFLVVDFIDLKRILRDISNELDHRVLLPRQNPVIRVDENELEVTVRYGEVKRWVFPREDCVILDIANTTAEEFARWISGRILEELGKVGFARPHKLMVEVEESPGQSARYERRLAPA